MAEFDFGRVLTRTAVPLKAAPLTFFGLSFLLVSLPTVLYTVLQQSVLRFALTGGGGPVAGTIVLWSILGWAVSMIVTALAQGALIHAAFAAFRGGAAGIGASLSTGLKHVLPVIVVSLAIGFGVAFGFLLLIVPGVFLLVKWIVAVPAEVVENSGIGGALGRSWALTKGHWWPIFGLVILYGIFVSLVQLLVAAPFGMGMDADLNSALDVTMSPLEMIGVAVASAITGAVSAAGVAALYYELRQAEAGGNAEELSAIFA